MLPTSANGQLGLAAYRRESDGVLHAHSFQVFTIAETGIARIDAFVDPGLFALANLPLVRE